MFFPFVSHDPLISRGPESVVTGLDSLHKDEQRVGESDTRLDSLSTGICRILTLGNNQNGFFQHKTVYHQGISRTITLTISFYVIFFFVYIK